MFLQFANRLLSLDKKTVMDYKSEYKSKIKLDLQEESTINKNFTFIDCPSCTSHVESDNININDKIAKCNSCNAVFPIHEELNSLLTKLKKIEIYEQPKGVEKYQLGDELELTLQQSVSLLEILVLTIFPFFAVIAFAAFTKGKAPIWISLAAMTPVILATLSLINLKRHKTQLIVTKEKLIVEHRPKKFRADLIYSCIDIKQLYSYKYMDSNGSQAYGVKVVLNGLDGEEHKKLLGGLQSLRHAKYVEQEIEEFLSIENKKMLEESVNV